MLQQRVDRESNNTKNKPKSEYQQGNGSWKAEFTNSSFVLDAPCTAPQRGGEKDSGSSASAYARGLATSARLAMTPREAASH